MKDEHRIIAEDMFSKLSMAMTQSGFVVPVYIMITPTEEVVPMVITDREMDINEYSAICHQIAQRAKAAAVMLVCEQMMVTRTKGDADLKALLTGEIRASQHPDSEAYLTLIYMEESGKCESMLAKIHKDPIGTPYTKDFKWIADSVTSMLTPWM